jgi:hypothetical protein
VLRDCNNLGVMEYMPRNVVQLREEVFAVDVDAAVL